MVRASQGRLLCVAGVYIYILRSKSISVGIFVLFTRYSNLSLYVYDKSMFPFGDLVDFKSRGVAQVEKGETFL